MYPTVQPSRNEARIGDEPLREIEARSVVERIYVGGLDPQGRGLTVEDVLDRIQKSLGKDVEIIKVDYHCGSNTEATSRRAFEDSKLGTFCHLDARDSSSGPAQESTATSGTRKCVGQDGKLPKKRKKSVKTLPACEGGIAFAKISKLLNNVTWKNCKLKVQMAKPHFLQRLQKEIEERQQQQLSATCEISSSSPLAAAPPIKRHLKVRCRYGDEAWSVDTKPCIVADSKGFAIMRQRYIKGRERKKIPTHQKSVRVPLLHSQQLVGKRKPSSTQSLQSCAQYNRSILLKFSDDFTADGTVESKENRHAPSEMRSPKKEGHSEAMSQTVESSGHTHESGLPGISDNRSRTSDTDEDDDSANDDARNKGIPTMDLEATPKSAYVWSDDDSSTSSSVLAGSEENGYQEVNARKEFEVHSFENVESRLDRNRSEETSSAESAEGENETSMDLDDRSAHAGDIDDDVNMNLSILASMFPELSPQRAAGVLTADQGRQNPTGAALPHGDQKRNVVAGGSSTNFSSSMIRFDPKKESSRLYLQKEERDASAETPDDGLKGAKTGGDIDGGSVGGPRQPHPADEFDSLSRGDDEASEEGVATSPLAGGPAACTPANDMHLYKQDALEEVFRQARQRPSRSGTTHNDLAGAEDSAQGHPESFGFSFDLGPPDGVHIPQVPPSTSQASFSFGFSVPSGNDNIERSAESSHLPDKNARGPASPVTTTLPKHSEPQSGNGRQLRTGFLFPEADLRQYVSLFYSLNDGDRILNDLDGWRKDPEVRASWERERQALTLDWKRKRKAALARKHHHHSHAKKR
jgi:hypothetical protein